MKQGEIFRSCVTGGINKKCMHLVQNGSGAHPSPLQWIPGDLSLGIKQSGREADHSPPYSAEVKE
jgi:hypothetical protein